MTKKQLIEKAKERFYAMGCHPEFNQILEDFLPELFPYVNKEGLCRFIERADSVVKQALETKSINWGYDVDYLKKLLKS